MTNEEIISHLEKLTEKDVVYTIGEWGEIQKDKPLRIPMNKEMIDSIIRALEIAERLKKKYHNFLGYDLEKCVKYGNENEEQRIDSYSTLMMYEIAMEFEDLLGD